MDNHEEILDALTSFGKNPNPQEIPSVLEQYLNSVAKNGETLFPWSQLKPLILRKMELVILELRRNLASETIPNRPNVENVRFDVMHARIIDSLHKFNGAPFTIQRLCELLIEPKRHYKRSDKFMRGLEKNVLVVSTVDPFGRKVVCESGNKPVLNGILDINGSYPPRDTALSVPLPPVPGWVYTTPLRTASGVTSSPADSKTGASNVSLDSNDKDTDDVSTSSSGGLAVSASVFSDQGDPLGVQSEEVVEETVVTMDTGEVGPVVTDGGEALADRETERVDLPDDREASFSSSSSSSSEELSTSSDSLENGVRQSSTEVITGTGLNDVTTMDQNRPWAAFAQSVKQQEDTATHSSTDNPADENQTSGVSSSSQNTSQLEASSTLSSTLSETQSTPSSVGDEEKVQNQNNSDSDSSGWIPPDDAFSVEQSTEFEPVNSASDSSHMHKDNSIDLQTEEKDNNKQVSTTTPATTTNNNITTTTTISSEPAQSIHISSSLTSSSDNVPPTYAQVVASSTDKSPTPSIQLTTYDSTDPVICDSVAGLERLVGSMEQSMSSPTSSSSVCKSTSSSSSSMSSASPSLVPSSHPHPTSTELSATISASDLGQNILISSTDSLEDEPVRKRLRLSVDEDEYMKEDSISTSGRDTSSEEMAEVNRVTASESKEEVQHHQQLDIIHSSSQEDKQNGTGQQEDMEIDSRDITASATEVVSENGKGEGNVGSTVSEKMSTEESSDVNTDRVDECTAESEESAVDSNCESLDNVSTTESEN